MPYRICWYFMTGTVYSKIGKVSDALILTSWLAGNRIYLPLLGLELCSEFCLQVVDLGFVSRLPVITADLTLYHRFHSHIVDDVVSISIEYESADLRKHENTDELEVRPTHPGVNYIFQMRPRVPHPIP